MKTSARLTTLFFILFCFNSLQAQNKHQFSTDTIQSGIKPVTSSFGPASSVRNIIQDKKGNIWLASNEGIIRYDGKSFTNITGNLSTNRFFSVVEDRKGNFWFGNYGSGVYYYNGKSFRHFTTREGLVDDGVLCIYEDRAGIIWIGTNGGVSRYNGTSFQNFTVKDGLPGGSISSVTEDKSGKLWFGACFYDGKTFTFLKDQNGNAFNNVWSVMADRKGNIWLGGYGLWRYDGRTVTNFTTNKVRYVYEDKKGNIWTSGTTAAGTWALTRYNEKSSPADKPTVIEIKSSLNLFGILEAKDGSIWFGSFDGVHRYDGHTITEFRESVGKK